MSFDAGFTFANTCDRSLLSTLNQRKYGVWLELKHDTRSLHEAAAREWNGLFQHPALGRCAVHDMEYHRPLDLLRHHLMPVVLPTNKS